MEREPSKPTRIKGRLMAIIKGSPESGRVVTDVVEQRENSVSGDRIEEQEAFPVKLINPASEFFKPYAEALDTFQKEVVLSEDQTINALTITQVTVPVIAAPEIYNTPYCGFPVIKGDKFIVRLSNGKLITV